MADLVKKSWRLCWGRIREAVNPTTLKLADIWMRHLLGALSNEFSSASKNPCSKYSSSSELALVL